MRRWLAVVAVAVLAATAGCSALGGGERTPTREPFQVAPTQTATPTPTATPTATVTPPPTETPPPRIGRNTEVQFHERRLRSIGNFTLRIRVNETGGRAVSRRLYRVDLDAGEYFSRERRDSGNVTDVTYAVNGTVYQRTTLANGSVRYRNRTQGDRSIGPREGAMRVAGQSLVRSLRSYEFTRVGAGNVDGELVRRYVATEAEPTGGSPYVEEIERVRVVVLVDHRGIVRSVDYNLTGRLENGGQYNRHVRLEVVELGTTTVRPPAWVSNRSARSET